VHTQNGKTALNTGASSGIGTAFVCSSRKETMMVQKMLAGLVVASLLALLVSACGIREASTIVVPTVHMGATGFIQDSITLHKGGMLDLVDDSISPHQIENGSWVNGVARPAVEPGAPLVNQAFNGNDSAEVGPFSTTGTFHFYCAIHQGMNLIVIVI
jgi:plastocyanin